jgi:50S ribosomal subunit-associated GTPase HflX
VEELLAELDLHLIPMLRIFNKVDLVQDQGYLQNICKRNGAIGVSAMSGDNLTSLVEAMEKRLPLVPTESRSRLTVQ